MCTTEKWSQSDGVRIHYAWNDDESAENPHKPEWGSLTTHFTIIALHYRKPWVNLTSYELKRISSNRTQFISSQRLYKLCDPNTEHWKWEYQCFIIRQQKSRFFYIIFASLTLDVTISRISKVNLKQAAVTSLFVRCSHKLFNFLYLFVFAL